MIGAGTRGGGMMVEMIKVSSVVYREDLYPRIKTSAETVQKYSEDLEVLPPIEVNQNLILIDGWHRWTAHKKNEVAEIRAIVTETKSEAELKELAIERNASHGLQLSLRDKKEMAIQLYSITPEREKTDRKRSLARILSVSERSVNRWVEDLDRVTREMRSERIFDLWISCHTPTEIAERVGCHPKDKELQIGSNLDTFPDSVKLQALFGDREKPIFNVWEFPQSEPIEPEVIDRLLHLFTEPFEVVIDVFGGDGFPIGICRKRLRRFFVSDPRPSGDFSGGEVRELDLTKEFPQVPRWRDVSLVLLRPRSWDEVDLPALISRFAKKLTEGARIAVLTPGGDVPPEVWSVMNPLSMRIVCVQFPEGQERKEKEIVNAFREILIFEVGGGGE